VKRLSGLIYEETRGVLKIFLENVRTAREISLKLCNDRLTRRLFETQLRTPSMPTGKRSCPQESESIVHMSLRNVRKTVTALDIVYALKRSGRTLYGFGA
jgi:histone H4